MTHQLFYFILFFYLVCMGFAADWKGNRVWGIKRNGGIEKKEKKSEIA